MYDGEAFENLVSWVISSGGAGVLGYKIVDLVPKLAKMQAEAKRYVALVISGVVGVLMWLLAVLLGVATVPGDWRAWLLSAANVALTAATVSQLVHARVILSKK